MVDTARAGDCLALTRQGLESPVLVGMVLRLLISSCTHIRFVFLFDGLYVNLVTAVVLPLSNIADSN
jgi:hypothetical protein